MFGKITNWFFKKVKATTVGMERTDRYADIPIGEDFIFEYQGKQFVGCRIHSLFGMLQIAVRGGLLMVQGHESVRIVRKATKEEAGILANIKSKINNQEAIAFFHLDSIRYL